MKKNFFCLACQKITCWKKAKNENEAFFCIDCYEEKRWMHMFGGKCGLCNKKKISSSYPRSPTFFHFIWGDETGDHELIQNIQAFVQKKYHRQLKKGLVFFCSSCRKKISKKPWDVQTLWVDYENKFKEYWTKEETKLVEGEKNQHENFRLEKLKSNLINFSSSFSVLYIIQIFSYAIYFLFFLKESNRFDEL